VPVLTGCHTGRVDDSLCDPASIVESLVGETLCGVRYFDVPNFGEDTSPWPGDGPHVLGHGLDLIFESRCVAITWGSELASYNISAMESSLIDRLLAGRFETVNEAAPWSALIGTSVAGVAIAHTEHLTGSGSVTVPYALVLTFDGGQSVVLAAANFDTDHSPALPGGDDLLVIWAVEQLLMLLPDLERLAHKLR
jgi:hypothetical protein